jgi:signal transduction histidine kinase
MQDIVQVEGFHSYAVFQMPKVDALLGIIVLYRDHIAPFSIDDQAIGQTIAYIASVAYQNIQLLTEIRHALIREQQLNDITRWLSTAPNLPAILSTTIRHSTELIGADAGLIGLVIDDQIMTYYPHNIPVSANLRPTVKGSGLAWQVVESKESIIGKQYQDHPKAQHKFAKVGMRAFIAVPIIVGEECLGALKLFSMTPGKTFSRRDLALAESIGRQAGIVLQNRRLYTDLTERAQALALALKKQEESDDAKNTFIHNVSHELRTPIGWIYGYSDLLQSGGLGELTPEQQNSMDIISKRVRMLINLLDDMSVLLAAETQEFRREEILPNELLVSVINEFQIEAKKSQIHLSADIEPDLPLIIGDPFHLRRVFDNLLMNAFKFTPPDGTILLRGWREGQELLIEIADTGAGISAEEMQRIFERFYQANSKSATHHKGKGTGLGLALVKEIVEAHRGKVTVRSTPGKGTTFKIRLPGFDL